MKTTTTAIGILLFATTRLASANSGTCQLASGAACTATAPPPVTAPAGMGQYCSITWPGGGWSFTSHTDLSGDPCAGAPAGGTVQRAGMYSASGVNFVVERCTDGRVGLRGGAGNAPLTAAFNDAKGHPGCVFSVSPQAFPVFNSPFSLSPLPNGYNHNTGFDFARYPYYFVDLQDDFKVAGGRPQSFILDQQGAQKDGAITTTLAAASNGLNVATATKIDVVSTDGFLPSGTLEVATIANGAQPVQYSGKTATSFTGLSAPPKVTLRGTLATGGLVAKPYGFIDDHSGHDFRMTAGATIYAVADGVVDMARQRDVTNVGCSNSGNWQAEVYIRHRFTGGKAQYDEVYESYYAHMQSISVVTGQIVHKGQAIGVSGHSGCTGGADHLHFGVFRMTNTASALSYPLIINTDFASGKDQNSDLGYRQIIEPYGFYPPTPPAFDPWGWRGVVPSKVCGGSNGKSLPCDWGALSVDLWAPGQQPSLSPSGDAVTW
jgi:murein DD-endopeptidase MepM/ murein hydrolase activator NlpD